MKAGIGLTIIAWLATVCGWWEVSRRGDRLWSEETPHSPSSYTNCLMKDGVFGGSPGSGQDSRRFGWQLVQVLCVWVLCTPNSHLGFTDRLPHGGLFCGILCAIHGNNAGEDRRDENGGRKCPAHIVQTVTPSSAWTTHTKAPESDALRAACNWRSSAPVPSTCVSPSCVSPSMATAFGRGSVGRGQVERGMSLTPMVGRVEDAMPRQPAPRALRRGRL